MKNRNFIIAVVAILVLIALIPVTIINLTNTGSVENIKLINAEIETLKTRIDSIKNPSYDKIKNLETKQKEYVLEIKQQNNRIEFISWVLGGITLFAVIFGFYEFYIGFKKRASDLIDNKAREIAKESNVKLQENIDYITGQNLKLMEKSFQEQKEVIELLLKEGKAELGAISKYEILFVYSGHENSKSNNRLIDFFKLNNLKMKSMSAEKVIEEKPETDIVFFNNEGNIFDYKFEKGDIINSEIIQEIILTYKLNKVAFFYYNDTRDNHNNDNDKVEYFSFANSYTTIYHNLIDLMRYKFLMDK